MSNLQMACRQGCALQGAQIDATEQEHHFVCL